MPEEKSPQKRERDPQALSSEYHKARKQLMLWAAILFVWELVGIDLEKAKETGGNAGAIITAIKSPQAIPWVLLILVSYFLIKTTVEWYQCNSVRRSLRVSKFDYYFACGVALVAFALYWFQRIKGTQLADRISSYDVARLALTFSVLLGLRNAILIIMSWRGKRGVRWQNIVQFGIAVLAFGCLLSPRIPLTSSGLLVVVTFIWMIEEVFGQSSI